MYIYFELINLNHFCEFLKIGRTYYIVIHVYVEQYPSAL